jgi:hypothetical protein
MQLARQLAETSRNKYGGPLFYLQRSGSIIQSKNALPLSPINACTLSPETSHLHAIAASITVQFATEVSLDR